MGNTRSGAGRPGAQALPLTRRQQKQVRQRQTNQQARQRQTRPPQPRQLSAPDQSIRDQEPVARAAASAGLPAVADAVAKGNARARRTERVAQSIALAGPTEDAPAPIRKTTRRVARTLAQAVKAVGGAQAPKRASSAVSERKYPTLARMAAIAPHRKQDAAAAAMTETSNEDEPSRGLGDESHWDDERVADERVEQERVEEAAPVSVSGNGHVPALVEEPLVSVVAPPTPTPDTSITSTRRPAPTRRLASVGRLARAGSARDVSKAGTLYARAEHSAHTPSEAEAELVVPLAAVHVGIAAAAALVGAGLLMEGVGQPLWPFTLAAIAGVGGWLGYALAVPAYRLAAGALVLADMGMLAWLLVLVGARGTILALAPAVVLLALLWLGRTAAYGVAGGALALYLLAALLGLHGALVPTVALTPGGDALLDGAFVAAGLLALVLPASRIHRAQARAEMAARALRHEARTLRGRLSQTHRQVEDDAEWLNEALARALAGKSTDLIETDGILSPLVETASAAAERLVTLQRDREERLRLEGAVRTVTQAVERAWLGLPWSWPDWSGTVLDELVALLRTPRPQEAREDWSDETPTLTAIPTVERGMTPHPWEPLSPDSGPISSVRMAWSQALSGRELRQQAESLAAGARALPPRLPWNEWDTWRDWVAERDD